MDDLTAIPIWTELAGQGFGDDPGPAYQAAHRHAGPGILRMPNEDGVVITAFETLTALKAHPALAAQNRKQRVGGAGGFGALAELDSNSPFFMNEPLHAPMAAAVYQPLSPARHEALSAMVNRAANSAADGLFANGGGDLLAHFAMPIALHVWLTLTGVPAEAAPILQRSSASVKPMLGFTTAPADVDWANRCAAELENFFAEHYARAPARSASALFSHLQVAIEASPLAGVPDSAAAMVAAMNFDAIDSVAGATANAIYVCLSDPGRWAELSREPSQVPLAWREAVRLEPSLIGLQRSALEDIPYRGINIPANTNVLMAWAAGNRDPQVYHDPDAFNLYRDEPRGLSFGGGPRICKGRHLAMLQGEIAIRVLLERTAQAELHLSAPRWSPPGMIRSLQQCAVEIR
jgi:cytochrome P450